ncbi:hypothetical protein [Cohnella massiliensis]|uniref:hypothetical protein n=1 Tax=Cohnella massiliensis TaxID=1816691 RepID=UPI0009BBE718|nr:hypothetical protein [Cohnella massiliensis]
MAIEKQIRLTRHAFDRYCQRVAPIGWQELERLVSAGIGERQPKDGYLQTGLTWWRAEETETEIILHTCYGDTHIDIPAATKWAKRFRDRIALGADYAGKA